MAGGQAPITGRLCAPTDSKASAEQVKEAYSKMASAVGPTLMTVLLESDDAFPEINHSGAGTPPASGRIVLYVDPDGACVLAECFTEYGRNPVFSVASVPLVHAIPGIPRPPGIFCTG